MKFFPLRRLEKTVNQGLNGDINKTDERILKTLGLLRASKKQYGNRFSATLLTWTLNEEERCPRDRIKECEKKFVANLEKNPNYVIIENQPVVTKPIVGCGFQTENVATITYSLTSGRHGKPIEKQTNLLGRMLEVIMSFKIINRAYAFDEAYKDAKGNI